MEPDQGHFWLTFDFTSTEKRVAGNLSTTAYDGFFQIFKVIYPDYASSHFVQDLQILVVDTFLQCWSIHLQSTDFYMTIDTDQGAQMIDHFPHSILDILNWFFPTWKTHQPLDAFIPRTSTFFCVTFHSDSRDTGLVVQLQVIPRGHLFSPHRARTLYETI